MDFSYAYFPREVCSICLSLWSLTPWKIHWPCRTRIRASQTSIYLPYRSFSSAPAREIEPSRIYLSSWVLVRFNFTFSWSSRVFYRFATECTPDLKSTRLSCLNESICGQHTNDLYKQGSLDTNLLVRRRVARIAAGVGSLPTKIQCCIRGSPRCQRAHQGYLFLYQTL